MEFRRKRFVDNDVVKLPRCRDPVTFYFPRKAVAIGPTRVLDILDRELDDNPTYQNAWDQAEDIYRGKRRQLLDSEQKEIPEECHIAIIAYTLETPLYKNFNKKCREMKTDDDWRKFPYKSLYCLLARSIHGVYNKPAINQTSYTGVDFHYNIEELRGNYNYAFHQFKSTSANFHTALQFASGAKGTILEFSHGSLAAIGIANHSYYYNEEEILLFPWNCFKIREIDTRNRIHRIVLEAGDRICPDLPYSGEYIEDGKQFRSFY